jgi:lysophospholipase L1-like esterase
MRLLALGDSYTIGEGVEPGATWPEVVARQLQADVSVVARTGWTCADLDAGIDAAAPAGPFSAVTLLVGVNDQYEGTPPESYRPAFRGLLRRAIALAGGEPRRVVVVSIPDWSATPFAGAVPDDAPPRTREQIAREVDAYNAVARAEAEAAGARWVDVTDLSRQQGGQVVADGLHPDASAYAAWAERIAPAVRAAGAA